MISLRCVDPSQEAFLMPVRKSEERKLTAGAAPTDRDLAAYTLSYTDESVVISNRFAPERKLVVDRGSLQPRFEAADAAPPAFLPMRLFAVWGVIELSGVEFLVLLTKAQQVAEVAGCPLFGVRSAKFLVLSAEKYRAFEHEKCWEQLKRTKNFLKTGFYFSYTYALTRPFDGDSPRDPANELAGDPFAWNYKSLKALGPAPGFFFPVMQGFVGALRIGPSAYTLISRRAFSMGGTRYNSRGADHDGRAANFVESEAVFETRNCVFALRQLRGSLPFYWEQPRGLKREVQIHQSPAINGEVFAKHRALLRQMGFERAVALNLLAARRAEEQALTEYFEQLIAAAADPALAYEYVDFHGVTRETDFSAVDAQVTALFTRHGADYSEWAADLLEGGLSARRRQAVVVRTNCLDCLDRTNAVQTKVAFYALSLWMERAGADGRVAPAQALRVLARGEAPWCALLRALWADNGDTISLIYAGTGATTSSVTRNGDRSGLTSVFDHGFKTLARFYLNNFEDDSKQQVIDGLLARRDTSVRRSLAEFPARGLAVLSLATCRSNGSVVVPRGFVGELLRRVQSAELVVLIAYVHTPKPVVVGDAEHLVLANFSQLFALVEHELGALELFQHAAVGQFEWLVLGRRGEAAGLQFFKAEAVRASRVQRPVGGLATLIYRQLSLSAFGVRLASGFLGPGPADTARALFEQNITRHDDFIFFAGPAEPGIELKDLSKRYVLCVDHAVRGAKDALRQNQLFLFVSAALAERCTFAPLPPPDCALGDELTLNAYSCLFRP